MFQLKVLNVTSRSKPRRGADFLFITFSKRYETRSTKTTYIVATENGFLRMGIGVSVSQVLLSLCGPPSLMKAKESGTEEF